MSYREVARRVECALVLATCFVAGTAGAADVGVEATKLVVVDKLATASKAKTVFVSKDDTGAITKGSGTDPDAISAAFAVDYDGTGGPTAGSFAVPAGALAGDAGWKANKETVASYVNKAAPGGPTGAKVAVIKPAKLLKLVGKSLGDVPLDLLGAGAPVGSVRTAYTVANDGETTRHCTAFGSCVFKEIGGGTGRKLVCKGGAPDPGCGSGGGTTTTTTTPASTTSTTTITSTTTTTMAVACELAGYPTCGGFCPAGQVCAPVLGVVSGLGSQEGCACVNPATSCSCAGRICPPSEVCVVQFLPDFSCFDAECAAGPTTTTLPDTGCCQGADLTACATGTIADECASFGGFFVPASPGDFFCNALGTGGACSADTERSVCCLVPFLGEEACAAVATTAQCLGVVVGFGSCDADGSCVPICGSSGQPCLQDDDCCGGTCNQATDVCN